MGETQEVAPGVDEARRAFSEQRWADARCVLAALPTEDLEPDDVHRYATASYLTGHDTEAFDLWARAHRQCAEQGDVERAVEYGIRLAQGLGFKGDVARSRGWVDRTARLLDRLNVECVQHGYLEHGLGMCQLFESGDVPGARERFSKAGKIAERHRDAELAAFARMGEGRMLIYLGEVTKGLALLDEAMTAVEAHEIPAMAIGDAYCTVIDACHELFDVRRCETWTASFTRWCDEQQGLVLYRGHCLLHRAELSLLRGAWPEALIEAREACARLAEPVSHATLGGANYLEGELHRLLGNAPAAEAAYRLANEHGCPPQPGLALLRLAEGNVGAAAATIRRVLAETEGAVPRVRVLIAAVDILLAADDVETAGAASSELEELAGAIGAPLLLAHAARAAASTSFATGDARGALTAARRAVSAYCELDAPYDAALARLVLADACDALGDHDGGVLERETAAATLAALGARAPGRPADEAATLPGGLTARELEVLVILAQGKTNRVIADELFISEKTVASHVSHIFTKLGVASRSAATAYAFAHGLVPTR